MSEIGKSDIVACMHALFSALEAATDDLCALDGQIGDGDHGIAMSEGFAAAVDAAQKLDPAATPTDVFNASAKALLNAVGASTGPLYATALMRAGASVKGKTDLDDDHVKGLIIAMTDGIAQRGKAQPGDKTMLDTWHAAAEAIRAHPDSGAKDALLAAADAAEVGAESTRAMEARMGRAARLGPRSIGHVDPGAASAAIIVRTMAETLA